MSERSDLPGELLLQRQAVGGREPLKRERGATADVNLLDDALSSRVARNGLQHQVWKENGGQFKQSEQFHLTFAPGSMMFCVTF